MHLNEAGTFEGKIRFPAFVVVAYLALPLFVLTGILPFEWRHGLLIGSALLLAAYAARRGFSLPEIGWRLDTLRRSLLWNGTVSVVIAAAIVAADTAGLIRDSASPEWPLFPWFYVLLSCPAQEFMFRGLLFAEMRTANIKSSAVRICASAIVYSIPHVVYLDLITVFATLGVGLVWGAIYEYHPNLIGVAASHAVLGLVSSGVGLV